MLSLIGLFAIAFVIVKYFPDILMFTVKAAIVLIGLYFLLGALLWIFGGFDRTKHQWSIVRNLMVDKHLFWMYINNIN